LEIRNIGTIPASISVFQIHCVSLHYVKQFETCIEAGLSLSIRRSLFDAWASLRKRSSLMDAKSSLFFRSANFNGGSRTRSMVLPITILDNLGLKNEMHNFTESA
jgi:hypothetical protein